MSKKNKDPDDKGSVDHGIILGTEIQKVLSSVTSLNKTFTSVIDSQLIVSKFAENLLAAITIPFDKFLESTLLPYKEINLPFNKFAETFRVVQDFNIRLSEMFSSLAESIFKPFEAISEIFRRNAEAMDGLFESIRKSQSFTKNLILRLPTITFDREFETTPKVITSETTQEKETPKEVKSWLNENKFTPFKPKFGIAEYRITIQGEKDGDVRIFTQKTQINDLSKVTHILPHLTEEKPLLPEFVQGELSGSQSTPKTPTSLQYKREEREMGIEENNGAFLISIEGIGVSKPVPECNWLKMLVFFCKYKSAPPETIIGKWNRLDKNSFKSRKKRHDKHYIPQIIRQIYDGIREYFAVALPYIKIKRNVDGDYVTYRLQVSQVPAS